MYLAPSRELVLKKLTHCFPDPHAAREALIILDTYGTEPWHREKNRVHLALLKISAGNLEKLRLYTTGAQTDYRDTLVAAEYPEQFQSSWKTPLRYMAMRKRDRQNYVSWLKSGDA